MVSELFLLELSSALSRRQDLITKVRIELEASPAAIVNAYILYIMSRYGLKLMEAPTGRIITPTGRVSIEVATAISHSTEFKLKSLDLLHLAYLLVLKEKGYPIEAMLTADREFLKVEKNLEKKGVRVTVPRKT